MQRRRQFTDLISFRYPDELKRAQLWREPFRLAPRQWLALSMVAVILLISLVACGGSGAQNGKVHLTYALWESTEQPAYQKSIDEFEKQHPNIEVTIQQTEYDQYWQKLDTEIVAGAAPDVFWSDLTYFPHYAMQGQIMDVTPLIQKDHLDLSIYYPSLLNLYTYQGKYYGLPKDWDTIALFYNKAIFKKMGITVPNELSWNPTDGGSFLKLCQQLTLDKNGHHADQAGFDANAISQYGFVSANLDQEMYWNYIAMNGGKFMDKAYGQHFEYNQPPSVQALQFLVDLILKWHVSPSASETNNSGDAVTQLFARGKAAMIQTGSWNVAYLSKQVNFPFGVIELPAGPKGRISVLNGLSDSINARTPHPQEAWELFKWLASPESQRIVAGMGTVWPGVKSAAPLFADYWKKQGIDVEPFLKEAEGQTVTAPITPAFNESSTKIHDDFNLMFLGQASVQQATNKAVQDGDAVIQASGG
ncbi:sugar ABC transporter substrate-binding protein [Ktedonosporobacter rubrisoli]|uniref:Sugar ABC transporter substrate-binding protein n=1 Tax=Ktedonosporobacter rubrisoli TaxID=2509675 RepID=A0A4P6JHY3_KTERU|nr:sugar ABC transporter substrate-binding protein [Ktedonosporobacter rubrisoli]QBD74655.1 sugar ABC transporter substrate-binding protein [Ktedonosporobacter rubrisoli]